MLKAGLRKQITLEQSDAFILQYKALFRSFNAFRDNPSLSSRQVSRMPCTIARRTRSLSMLRVNAMSSLM